MKIAKRRLQASRSIYIILGHDEEVGGNGATAAVNFLRAKNVHPNFVLDEGGVVTIKDIPGLQNRPVALIGTSEKGYLSLDISTNTQGGHSSMPSEETAIDIIVKAVQNIRDIKFEPAFSQSTVRTFDYLGPEMPFSLKMIIANRWLFKSFLLRKYQKTPAGNAIIRTTIAPTIIEGGIKDNVIPSYAHAVINFRILPGNDISSVIEHVKKSIMINALRLPYSMECTQSLRI